MTTPLLAPLYAAPRRAQQDGLGRLAGIAPHLLVCWWIVSLQAGSRTSIIARIVEGHVSLQAVLGILVGLGVFGAVGVYGRWPSVARAYAVAAVSWWGLVWLLATKAEPFSTSTGSYGIVLALSVIYLHRTITDPWGTQGYSGPPRLPTWKLHLVALTAPVASAIALASAGDSYSGVSAYRVLSQFLPTETYLLCAMLALIVIQIVAFVVRPARIFALAVSLAGWVFFASCMFAGRRIGLLAPLTLPVIVALACALHDAVMHSEWRMRP